MSWESIHENEATIADQASKYNVALEWGKEYAETVGVIISLFAIVEDYPSALLVKITEMDSSDAMSILSTFRAFSNRLDLLKEVARNRPEGSVGRICLSYYRGIMSEANKIRNKYAHAKYSYAKTHFVLETYASDTNRNAEQLEMTLKDFQADRDRLKRIICELHAFCYRDEIPLGLHKQLSQPTP